jgi:D-glucosaminate-specific PTS system IIB component
MDNLKLTRIDFRLIHGQVMTRWVKQYGITDIVVIHDKSANSPILKKILLNAAPAGVNVQRKSGRTIRCRPVI